jgi:hypothetical protein
MAAGPTYYPIATNTLSSTASSYTFSDIPQTYNNLVLVMNVVPNGTGGGTFIVNNDTSSVYSYTALAGLATTGTPVSYRGSNQTSGGWLSSGAALTNSSNLHLDVFHFMNYSSTSTYKTVIHREDPSQFGYIGAWVNLYRSTSPITSITMQLTSSFGIGTTFTLYGIKAA